MSTAFGLDFGTTNSVLAIAQDGLVEIADIDPFSQSKKTLKSVIFFDEDKNSSVGERAIEQYIEFGGSYGRFMQSIKAFLPDRNFTETFVFGKRFEIEDLVSLILKEIKHRGELQVGHVVDTVVLGRPVVFSEDRENDLLAEERLRTAALKAGFLNIHFLYEPIAATLAYESTLKEGEEKVVFMGDFGGGTSDFVIMRLRGGKYDPKANRKQDILSIGGVYVGGDSFDSAIMWHKVARHFGRDTKHKSVTSQELDMPVWIPRTLCQWHLISRLRDKKTLETIRSIKATADDRQAIQNLEELILGNLGYMVFRSIEQAKCVLSDQNLSQITFSEGGIAIKESIDREEFESLSAEEIAKIGNCANETLLRSGVSTEAIDLVLLTGGSSFIPAVQQIFTEKFGKAKMYPIDAFTSVAYGLGLYASMH